jgi:hypothetical protein
MLRELTSHPEAYRSLQIQIRSTGERVWLTWTNKAIVDDQGRLQEILGIGIDLTW